MHRTLARFATTFALCLLSISVLSKPLHADDAKKKLPNIVYVLADDLGYHELGCYGQKKIRTPNIDRIAREGMRFTQHYSGSPVCAPSRCVLLTGLHTGHSIVRNNWEGGGWGKDAKEGQYPLPKGTQTLGRYLQSAGYRTAAIGKWGLGGPGTSGAPNLQGFDLFYGYLCQRVAHNYYPTHLWRNDKKDMLEGNDWFHSHQKIEEPLATEAEYFRRFARKTYAPEKMSEEALRFVRENKDRPFFLYYPSPIPHVSIQVPEKRLDEYPREWDEKHYLGQKAYLPHPRPRAGYAAMVTQLDREVGAILDLLDELDLTKNTLVMFSSDNGPTFNGGSDSKFFESAGRFRGLKVSVHEGGIRVPFVARWPEKIRAGSISDHISAFQDVLPTLLDVVGEKPEAPVDGISLLPTLLGRGEQKEHEYLYWELKGQQALRAGPWKAVRTGMHKGVVKTRLYKLDEDIGERRDLAKERPEMLRDMEALLKAARFPSKIFPIPALDGPSAPKPPKTSPEVRERF